MQPAQFFQSKPLIGMVHLPPLPGTPQNSQCLDTICARAVDEAHLLEFYGMDALLVENFGDVPFYPGQVPAYTIAAMACVARAVRECVSIPVGINVLRNDATAALSIASAVGAQFIRVNVHVSAMLTDQGIIQGKAHETLRLRQALGSDVWIFADVCVKHAVTLGDTNIVEQAKDTLHRGLADALIITGSATGDSVQQSDLIAVKQALPEAYVLAGSGVTPETLPHIFQVADGAILGTALKHHGKTMERVDPSRVKRMALAT